MKNDPETWLSHSTMAKNKIENLQNNSESQDKSLTAENHKSPAAEAYTSLMTPTCTSISHTIGLAKPAPTLSEITGVARLPANFYDQIAQNYFGSSPFVRTYLRKTDPVGRAS